MRCVEVRDILSDYADGAADQRGRRIAERHIALCSACRRQVVIHRRIGQQLRGLPLIPPGITERLPRLRQDLTHALARRRQIARILGSLGLLLVVLSAAVWTLALR